MNRWVIVFPCLMYLGSVGTYLSSSRTGLALTVHIDNIVTGILAICLPIIKDRGLGDVWPTLPYLSISLSTNIILTLMIVVRLVLHGRNVRAATGSPGGGLYKTIATMLVESSALFAVSSLLVIGSLAAKSSLSNLFVPILSQTQVRAFSYPPSSHGLSNMTADRTGHRSPTHHSTSCQQKSIDEKQYCPWEHRQVQR